MVRRFYPDLFRGTSEERAVASLGERTFELAEFLKKVLKVERWPGRSSRTVTYHDSCHLRRELGVHAEPRELLGSVEGVKLVELKGATECCGFGGLFSVKYPDLSTEILGEKLGNVTASGADVLVLNDAGCLAQISGGLARRGNPMRVLHFAEFLAESLDGK
jgi:L-lactate dehydrogenase complex protein LldE